MQTSTAIRLVKGNARQPDAWIRAALTLWIFLAAAASVKVLVQPQRHTVYPVFAAGARHWWAGIPMYTDYEGLDLFRYAPAFGSSFHCPAGRSDAVGFLGARRRMASINRGRLDL